MNYILERGVKCIGTDGPSMGSVNPEEATMTHWAAASREGVFVECSWRRSTRTITEGRAARLESCR